jgi:hypothetical protein
LLAAQYGPYLLIGPRWTNSSPPRSPGPSQPHNRNSRDSDSFRNVLLVKLGEAGRFWVNPASGGCPHHSQLNHHRSTPRIRWA